MEENENKKEVMVLSGSNFVAPKAISKQAAYNIANEQEKINLKNEEVKRQEELKKQQLMNDSVAQPIKVTKKVINMEMVNQVNDLASKEKEEYVKIVEMQHSPKTYLFMILALGAIIAVIVFEIIYYASK